MKNLKEVDGKKLHAGMLEAAEKAVAGQGDGRISENDAKNILKHLDNDPSNVGRKTWNHILENYNVTPNAERIALPKSNNVEAIESVQTAPEYPNWNIPNFKEGDIFVIANMEDTPNPPDDIGSTPVLNCSGDGTGNHTPIQLWDNGAGLENQWMLFVNPKMALDSYGNIKGWHLVNINSGKFLDINTGNNTLELYSPIDGGLESVDRNVATWSLCSRDDNFPCGKNEKGIARTSILNLHYNKFISRNDPTSVDLKSWKYQTGQFWAFYWLSNQKPSSDTPEHHKIGLPSLTSYEPAGGTTSEVKSAGYALIPFYRCQDSAKTESWRIQNSPFYKLYRDTYWKCVTWGNNTTGIVQKPSFTTEEQTGYSKTEKTTFSESVGVTVGVSVGEPGASFSEKVSVQLGYSETSSFTSSFSYTESRSFPLSIKHSTCGSVWVLVNRYTLKRNNGEVVSTHEVNDGSNTAYSQYPKPENFKEEDAVYKLGMNDPS